MAERNTFWLQQDGAPLHNAEFLGNYLTETFHNRRIGTYGPVRWPPSSPELNLPGFFLFEDLKKYIYKTNFDSWEELLESI